MLITAAHNYYRHDYGKEADDIYVLPAVSPSQELFGKIKVKEVRYLKEFRNLNSKNAREYDLALLILEEPIGAKLGLWVFLLVKKFDRNNCDYHRLSII